MVNTTSAIKVRVLDSPLGGMIAASTNTGLILLEFGSLQQIAEDLDKLAARMETKWALEDHPVIQQVASELSAYFSGTLKKFTVPLEPHGNAFSQSVWQSLLSIPYGQTWTYKKQAEIMHNPLAIRAIAAANGRNPVAIIIPCHRVIGSDGSLTGYAGGLERKKWLLQFERSNCPAPPGSLF